MFLLIDLFRFNFIILSKSHDLAACSISLIYTEPKATVIQWLNGLFCLISS